MRIKSYKRLSAEEREEISRCLANGESFQDIARLLGRAVSTITWEVCSAGANRWTYRAGSAQRQAEKSIKLGNTV
ncbi:MAG: hypothetical protein A2043_11130 [Candidatus Schekmanbacteria bacterium GWA2_38_9]|uniref:Transposase IS30-like HTH domain-containing protein n=1 Tax=Candidatus Schekmanbacteria bacterium RIFCSPLOWO2_12_FULL_38_15 TaxID=1817883 RepID=A0A1F7SG46_9BACT|nr:MAG: hypothetical protein A2043_11130 [Candidatus Schekmanbacteria bacterium GWA2_38_9]OGL49887.1 MAG: hypothetical protein A3H37_09775 [Candidatus Schekmanbacteria bacterium RIFCSPLOWO2_02_FULL_38_14]OGL52773.1 MAG: hypothetical protein A3G31_00025 [Candidatus Schekmanbacteria bacterium RIFCSPLOWO2_12_FULL_38_15]